MNNQQKLVLIGGGHSHAIALRLFGINPLPNVRLTLISEAPDTPYSGMLPGHIAGFYTHDECHINLRSLTQFAQAELMIDRVIGLDLENNKVICADRQPVYFDFLSIDIGSTPATISVPGAAEYAIAVKPVPKLLQKWNQLIRLISNQPEKPICFVKCESGLKVEFDYLFWVTQASAPDWPKISGLATDATGFILVNDNLQSVSHPHVFAAGDIATIVNNPCPKAGVFAVRQGKPLFNNLRQILPGKPLQPYKPQKRYLSLIGTGDGSAIASWGSLGWESPLLWYGKDWIDRRFMAKFHNL
ncbi:FAD-dependent oxidoreductase [Argonema galeatum A003/A1]|nr:FAD-dependent oxidoreductase [Argonema galeatum]MCL1467387.1 FAD-dependent oxidoreductase [Argonema galeatum A003/A1]